MYDLRDSLMDSQVDDPLNGSMDAREINLHLCRTIFNLPLLPGPRGCTNGKSIVDGRRGLDRGVGQG